MNGVGLAFLNMVDKRKKTRIIIYIFKHKGRRMKTNPTIISIVTVVELGKATTLTMGMGIRSNEGSGNNPRPYTLQ
jgi:hypothetical protein